MAGRQSASANYLKLNVFRKRGEWMNGIDLIPPDAKVFIQADNCLLTCGNFGIDVESLPEASPNLVLKNSPQCKHEYVSKQCQLRSGDEAFTSILICKLCNKQRME